MHVLMLPFAPRFILYTTAVAGTVSLALLALWQPALLPFLSVPIAVFAGLAVLGTVDLVQTRHAVLRNDPISAHDAAVFLRRREAWAAVRRRSSM